MKEWALKHPILTFLLIDIFIGSIRVVALSSKAARVQPTATSDGDSPEENEDQEDTLQKQIEHKEDTK